MIEDPKCKTGMIWITEGHRQCHSLY